MYDKQGSGRVADFFKRWLLYTKEFDDASQDHDIAYEISEISEIDKKPPVTTMTTSDKDNTNNSKSRQSL